MRSSLTRLQVSEAAACNFLKLIRNVAFFTFRLFDCVFPWIYPWKQPFTTSMKMTTLKTFSVTLLVESIFHKAGGQETPNIMKMDFVADFFS